MATAFSPSGMAAAKHRAEAKPNAGVIPRAIPSAILSANFSGVVPCRSNAKTQYTIFCPAQPGLASFLSAPGRLPEIDTLPPGLCGNVVSREHARRNQQASNGGCLSCAACDANRAAQAEQQQA